MANVFLNDGHEEIETAILLEKATQCDLAEISSGYANAVAFTDGTKVFINSDDNLAKILPDYNKGMLKWLLWHEEYHKQLKHHNRFFKYLDELRHEEVMDEFQVTKEEVNIIMDILVHDSLSRMFPELVETAVNNLAQMRNRNSLGYTFKTFTLEEMLDEYSKYKHPDKDEDKDGKGTPDESKEGEGEGLGDTKSSTPKESEDDKKDSKGDGDPETKDGEKGHEEGGGRGHSSKEDETSSEVSEGTPPKSEPEHDKTDWSKLDDINPKEFIDADEAQHIDRAVKELKQKKLKLARLTEKLNGLATSEKVRTYARPSYIGVDHSIMLKGRKQGRTSLYLVFDASGSMGDELALFKKIISESIPQAMGVPTEWFSGYGEKIPTNPEGRNYDYYKGTFKDIMPVRASSGYGDDGDRVIELCQKAEEKGFSPIGVTDGGGGVYEPDILKKLTRTVLVVPSHESDWIKLVKSINPRVQIIEV